MGVNALRNLNMEIIKQLKKAGLLLAAMTLITGVAYPMMVTLFAQTVFAKEANGSLLRHHDKVVGSALIGQPFDNPRYFWSRPSATTPGPYNAGSSSGSNLAVSNPALRDAVAARVAALRRVDPENRDPIPVDLVTASASGLDPHISPAAARYQTGRVARARRLDPKIVEHLVDQFTESPQLGLFGASRVNVLKLNLALDYPDDVEIPHSWKDPM